MTEQENPNEIYNKLRSLRRARGLSINEFADQIGEDYQKIGRIERGKRALTIDCFVKMARALEAPVESFLDDEPASEGEAPQGELISQIVSVSEGLEIDPKAKGDFVAQIYQLCLKFPPAFRKTFLTHFFEGLVAYQEVASNNSPVMV